MKQRFGQRIVCCFLEIRLGIPPKFLLLYLTLLTTAVAVTCTTEACKNFRVSPSSPSIRMQCSSKTGVPFGRFISRAPGKNQTSQFSGLKVQQLCHQKWCRVCLEWWKAINYILCCWPSQKWPSTRAQFLVNFGGIFLWFCEICEIQIRLHSGVAVRSRFSFISVQEFHTPHTTFGSNENCLCSSPCYDKATYFSLLHSWHHG